MLVSWCPIHFYFIGFHLFICETETKLGLVVGQYAGSHNNAAAGQHEREQIFMDGCACFLPTQ